MIPPWPAIVAPKSLTPRSRLIEDITSPPKKPIRQETNARSAACHQANGVIHQRPAPTAVAVSTPPIKPSQVLLGDTDGATGCLPRVLPHTYWNTSESWTTTTKNSMSNAPSGPPEPRAEPSAMLRPSDIMIGSCIVAGM